MLGVRNHAREHGTMLRRAWRKLYEGWSVADSRDLSILLRLLRSALGDDFRKKLPDCGGSGDSAESGRSAGDSAGFNGMGCRSDSGGVCNGHCRRKQEQIGKGDAWILLALGVLVGAGRCMGLFVTALVLSLPFSAVWHVACHWKKCGRNIFATPVKEEGQTAFPFAPGLLLAYVLWSV